MALALTVLELVHVNWVQTMLMAKCRQVRDDYRSSVRTDETGMNLLHTLFPISVCPTLMATQPPMCNCYHMRFFQPSLSTEGRKIGNGSNWMAIWIDESFPYLDEFVSR